MTLAHDELKQRKERERSLKANSDSPTLLGRSSRGYHTITKVAPLLGLSVAHVRRKLARKELLSIRIGKYVLVDLDSVARCLEQERKESFERSLDEHP